MRSTKKWWYLILGCVSCGSQQYLNTQASPPQKSEVDQKQSTLTPSPRTEDTEPTVCDPFAGGSQTGSKNGLEGRLHYLPASIKFLESNSNILSLTLNHFDPTSSPLASQLVSPGSRLIFSRLNAPTQAFELGFRDASGNPLKDKSGNALIEFFGLHLQTRLTAPIDGKYQLAIMSDDGSTLSASINNRMQRLLDNDFVHSNRIHCSPSEGIPLKKDTPLPLQIRYFQGPRTFINLMLFWRRVEGVAAAEPECMQAATSSQQALDTDRANDYFFQNGNPTNAMHQFLTRGWQVIPANHFWLEGSATNPCVNK